MTDPDRETLLIVDDEEGPRESLKIVFEERYHVILAKSGEEAIEVVKKTPVHAAVLDIRMAGITGIEVLKSLKELDEKIEVIMLTAYETLETARQALRYGASDYIGKPFNVKAMRTAVKKAMDRRRLAVNLSESAKRLDSLQSDLENLMMREEMARTSSQVYAGVLHDINNPLTIIRGYVDMLMHRLTKISSDVGDGFDGVLDNMNTIAQQVNVCCSISNRHLELIRRDSSEGQDISVNLILRDLEELIKVHPAVKAGMVRVEYLKADTSVFIHASELMQILLNLVTNALQSSSSSERVTVTPETIDRLPHGGTFSVGPGERIINKEVFDPGKPYILLTVSDKGKGISPDIISDVFEPYFTTKKEDKGTGLGLAIVARLVKRNRGAVHLRTRVGEGTSFTLYFPQEAQ